MVLGGPASGCRAGRSGAVRAAGVMVSDEPAQLPQADPVPGRSDSAAGDGPGHEAGPSGTGISQRQDAADVIGVDVRDHHDIQLPGGGR